MNIYSNEAYRIFFFFFWPYKYQQLPLSAFIYLFIYLIIYLLAQFGPLDKIEVCFFPPYNLKSHYMSHSKPVSNMVLNKKDKNK